MGPQDPKDVSRDIACDLSSVVRELAAVNGEAHHWLKGREYAALRHRFENAHAAVAVALIETTRRVTMNEGR
jgi:hypothetical protein